MFSSEEFINIHTHSLQTKSSVSQIYSHPINRDLPSEGFFSIGMHPWHIEENKLERVLSSLMELVTHPNVIAIGEIGLDRAIEAKYELQEQFFKAQLTVSEYFKKPVIIHSVKAHSDLLFIHKSGSYKMPWIIHGFNAHKKTADQLIKANFYLSFGEALMNEQSKAFEVFPLIPTKQIFLETDDSSYSIEEIYEKAASLKKMKVEQLKQKIADNFQSCFK